MKKTILVLLLASMILGLVLTGCSKNADSAEEAPNTEVTEADKTTGDEGKKADEETETNTAEGIMIINQKVAELEEAFPDIEIDIEVTKQLAADIEEYKTIDVDIEKDTELDIMDFLGNVLKYEVSDLDYEGYDNQLYDLSYFSEAQWEDIVVYFHMLLHGTDDFRAGIYNPEMGKIGGAIKGTFAGLTVVVEVEYDEDIDETYVVIFCRPFSW